MKIANGFEIKKVLEQYVVIATGSLSEKFHGVIKLNRTAYEIWDLIEKGYSKEQIISRFTKKYSINEEKAKCSVEKIIKQMIDSGVIETNNE